MEYHFILSFLKCNFFGIYASNLLVQLSVLGTDGHVKGFAEVMGDALKFHKPGKYCDPVIF